MGVRNKFHAHFILLSSKAPFISLSLCFQFQKHGNYHYTSSFYFVTRIFTGFTLEFLEKNRL